MGVKGNAATPPSSLFASVDGRQFPHRILGLFDALAMHQGVVIEAPDSYEAAELFDAWLRQHPDIECLRVADAQPVTVPAGTNRALMLVTDPALITDGAAISKLVRLTEAHARLGLVIISPVRPTAQIGRLAARGQLVVLGVPELSWTQAEMDEYLEPVLSGPADSARIRASWLGWPLANRLFKRCRQSKQPHGDNCHLLASYIDSEILGTLPAEDLRLLTKLSTLPWHTAESAGAITRETAAIEILDRLPALGIPVDHNQPPGRVAMLPPVRSMLLRELGRDPELAAALAERSLLWLDDTEQDLDAIELSATFLDERTTLLLMTQFLLRHRLDDDLGPKLAELTRLLPTAAWLPPLVQTFSAAAPTHLPTQTMEELTAPLLEFGLEGRLMRGLLHLSLARNHSYATDNLADILAAVEDLDELNHQPAALTLRAGLQIERGLCHAHHGDLELAQPLLFSGTELARMTRQPYYESLGLGGSAWVLSLIGRAEQARFYANNCLALRTTQGSCPTSGSDYAHLALAELAVEEGNLEGSIEHHANCRPNLWPEQETYPLSAATAATIHLVQGGVVEVLATIDAAAAGRSTFTDFHKLLVDSHAVYGHLMDGNLVAADHAFAQLPQFPPGTSASRHRAMIEGRVQWSKGKAQEAIETLDAVTDPTFGHPASKTLLYSLLFQAEAASTLERHDDAADLRKRAKVVAATLGIDIPGARHRNLNTVMSLTGQLTETELKVLEALDSLDSLHTIAGKLFISINTLKTHTRRIYRKLDVTSRDAAVDRAYVIRLLPVAKG